jgi:hypothetical protein
VFQGSADRAGPGASVGAGLDVLLGTPIGFLRAAF